MPPTTSSKRRAASSEALARGRISTGGLILTRAPILTRGLTSTGQIHYAVSHRVQWHADEQPQHLVQHLQTPPGRREPRRLIRHPPPRHRLIDPIANHVDALAG